MQEIALSGRLGSGRVAIVDDEDYDRLARFRWWLQRGYAVRHPAGAKSGLLLGMHRDVMGLGYGDPEEVDHRRGDTLDNRKANLRICTTAENQQNRQSGYGTSGFRGVYWNAARQLWQAQVKHMGRTTCAGRFTDELEAARAAQALRIEMFPFSHEERI